MKAFEKFDPWRALGTIVPPDPAKAAKAANPEPDTPNFSDFSDFSGDESTKTRAPGTAGEAEREERRVWSDDLCRRLSEGIAHQSLPGMGWWEPAWEIVEAPSERLLSVLADWEQSGDVADQRAAIIAAEDVAFAWERAATAWTATKQRKGAR